MPLPGPPRLPTTPGGSALSTTPPGSRNGLAAAAVAATIVMVLLGGFWLSLAVGGDPTSGPQGQSGPRFNAPADDRPDETPSDDLPAASPESAAPVQDLTAGVVVAASATGGPGQDASGATVFYDAVNLVDGSTGTAWRMDGDGAGSTITFTFPQSVSVTELGLVNGYAKQDATSGADRYTEERRVLRVTWTGDDGVGHEQRLVDGLRGMQRIAVPGFSTSSLVLRIDETSLPGDADRDYTAISEVTIGGYAGWSPRGS